MDNIFRQADKWAYGWRSWLPGSRRRADRLLDDAFQRELSRVCVALERMVNAIIAASDS